MTETALPLAGLRVLDISSFIAAPAAAVVLGDWGADVIKVEGPEGDPNRRIMHDSSNYPKSPVNYPWQMDSRNKRSIVLDLKQADARAALDRLIAISDILICNFPPPVRDKLKLAYDGTNYHGWQRQPDRRTVQGTLEDAIFKITRQKSQTFTRFHRRTS